MRRLSAVASVLLLSGCGSAQKSADLPELPGPQIISKSAQPPKRTAAGKIMEQAVEENLEPPPKPEPPPEPAAKPEPEPPSEPQESLPGIEGRTGESETDIPAAADEPALSIPREQLLHYLGDMEIPLDELLKPDEYDGPTLSAYALEAYANGKHLKAVLLAQSALGADPGNGTRRKLLTTLENRTGVSADPEGILPKDSLVHHELSQADAAFFQEKFGAALQHCRRALLIDPQRSDAWQKLGSAHYAAGSRSRARESYLRALELTPKDPILRDFLAKRGWLSSGANP